MTQLATIAANLNNTEMWSDHKNEHMQENAIKQLWSLTTINIARWCNIKF